MLLGLRRWLLRELAAHKDLSSDPENPHKSQHESVSPIPRGEIERVFWPEEDTSGLYVSTHR